MAGGFFLFYLLDITAGHWHCKTAVLYWTGRWTLVRFSLCVLNLAVSGCLSHTIHTLEIHCVDFQSMPS